MKTISPWFRTASLLRSIQRVLAKTAQSQDEERFVPRKTADEHRSASERDETDQS